MAAAVDYPEDWIEERAAGIQEPIWQADKSDGPTRYQRIITIEETQPDGTEVTLALQSPSRDETGEPQ
jgi:hypothetical protein